MTRRAGPRSYRVATGTVTLRPDPDAAAAWIVDVDGTLQSHVDLHDPTRLAFDYVRRIGHVLDLAAPAGAALDVVHLGGGGLTLPRYVAVTRPGSRQRVFEVDAVLTEIVRRELPLARGWRIRVGAVDAREGLAALRDASADVVVADVFAEARTPAHLASVAVARDAARVLRPAGALVVNVVDAPPLAFARAQVANLAAAFAHVAVVIEPATLRGRRRGNIILVGSGAALPWVELAARAARDPEPARVLSGAAVDRFRGGAAVVDDSAAEASPAGVDRPA